MMTSLKYSQDTDSNPEINVSRLNDTIFTKELLKRLNKYSDDEDVTLEESIPILYELNIFQELTSIPDAKRRLTQESKPNNRLQLEARFIYNLWKLIGNEFISMSYFKQIIALFITLEISELAIKLEQVFENEADLLVEILAIWEAMLENNHSVNCSQEDFKESSVVTEEERNFNDQEDFNSNHNQSSNKYGSYHFSSNKMSRNHSSINNRQKQDHKESYGTNGKVSTDRFNSKSRRENIQQVTDEIYSNGLYELPVLSVEKEKELVNRLYVVNKNERYEELKKMQDEEKILKEMQECTFRPNTDKNKKPRPYTAQKVISKPQSKTIPGYEKAIERMKIGQEKTKELKEKLELRSSNIKEAKLEISKVMIPPKFLARENKKEEKKILFTIQFDIGRHKLTSKIHENESAEQLARNIQSIYSLKQESYEEIKSIIDQEMERYFSLNKNQENEHEDQEYEN